MGYVGQEVRRIREEKGWSQPKLAVEAGVAVSGVSQIENGKRNPNSATLAKLAKALDVEIADLFPKAETPLWSDETPAERRAFKLLQAWRTYVWDLALRWEKESNQPTPAQVRDVLDALQKLINAGAFERPPETITTNDVRDVSEWAELSLLFKGIDRLRAVAERVVADEQAEQLRGTFALIDGYRNQAVG